MNYTRSQANRPTSTAAKRTTWMALAALTAILALAAVPGASADRQSTLEVVIPALGADAPVMIHQTWPELPVPKGAIFTATFNGYTGSSSHTIDFAVIHLHGGCVEDHRHVESATISDESLTLHLNMLDADNCHWHVEGFINATGIGGGERAKFQLTGNVPSYTMHDFGQEPTRASVEFYVPTLFWIAVLAIALYMDWLFIAGFSIPGLLINLFPDQIPGDFEQYLVWAILGVVMEYFAFRRRKKSRLTA